MEIPGNPHKGLWFLLGVSPTNHDGTFQWTMMGERVLVICFAYRSSWDMPFSAVNLFSSIITNLLGGGNFRFLGPRSSLHQINKSVVRLQPTTNQQPTNQPTNQNKQNPPKPTNQQPYPTQTNQPTVHWEALPRFAPKMWPKISPAPFARCGGEKLVEVSESFILEVLFGLYEKWKMCYIYIYTYV